MNKLAKNSFQNWLEGVRYGDEATKKFWLFMMSSISTVIVVTLWISYINLNIPTVGAAPGQIVRVATQPIVAKAGQSDNESFMANVGVRVSRGIALAKSLIRDNLLGKPTTINIDKKDQNFILKTLPELGKQRLPQ